MPTALSLKIVMEELEETDNSALTKLTGLSEPQIERCKLLIALPERFQEMSLDPDSKTRVPSNFWIESAPVLDLAVAEIGTIRDLGRMRATDKLVEKYRAKKIKSVIHFRRILDAYEITEDDPDARRKVLRRVEQFFLNRDLETRAAFDEFVLDVRRTRSALTECEEFVSRLRRLKLTYIADDDDRSALRTALQDVRIFCMSLEQILGGTDDPDVSTE